MSHAEPSARNCLLLSGTPVSGIGYRRMEKKPVCRGVEVPEISWEVDEVLEIERAVAVSGHLSLSGLRGAKT
eukprot:2647377-Rhodomonas_salina.1